ncbi:ABC transporter permease [Ferrovibrio sp.]|uniref:ABC transporter permease n=1 Tax=Ferrovibrio sp. TaxID=1917215 RepID=UPI0025BF6A79|nr:ABC transporter permease [Ferrovibrio sp.]MBX3453358.1 ABC transporter permease [Ferrovibrio sp.]
MMPNRFRLSTLAFLAPAVIGLLVFFIGPLLLNVEVSLREQGGGHGLAQYLRALGDAYYVKVWLQTIVLAACVTFFTLLFGYPFAFAIARSRGPVKGFLIFLIVTPLLINVVVRTFGWMVVLGRSGLINGTLRAFDLPTINMLGGWFAIGITLVHVMLPFMVLSIASALEGIDQALEQAALTLGAKPAAAFRYIIWPLSLDGVITGTLLVFSLSIGSFVTVMLMGNNRTMVLPVMVYQQLNLSSDWPFAAALGMVLLVTVLVISGIQLAIGRRLRRGQA